MPKGVDTRIRSLMKQRGLSMARAIAILKSRGIIKQSGKHLVLGPKAKKK
jgi:hypothetical protein